MNIRNPDDSVVLLPSSKKAEIDWNTADRIAALNPDFRGFINSTAKSVKINYPSVDAFDRTMADSEMADYAKKLRGE
jgi:hypothetical protein